MNPVFFKRSFPAFAVVRFQWRDVGGSGPLRTGNHWKHVKELLYSVDERLVKLGLMLQNLELLSLDFAHSDFVLTELDKDRSRGVSAVPLSA